MSTRHLHRHWSALRRNRLSRRSLLAASSRAGVGAASLALVGCSGDDEQAQQDLEPDQQTQQQAEQADAPSNQPNQPDQPQQSGQQSQQSGQQSQQAAQQESQPQPSGPTRGGIIRTWLAVERHDRWDPHRSRYRYTQAAHSLMYNRLIQPASASTGELEADLCALPEMPDETTYVFTVNPDAAFWNLEPTNGRTVTAQDIAWNIQRQQDALDASGAPDPYFFRRAAYNRTTSVEASSDTSATLTTTEPDATYLSSVHASPFAWITSPEASELYADDWRDDPSDIMRNSGTGPYTPRLFNGFEITLARSENWWPDDSAWADGINFTSGDTNNIVSLYDAAAFDTAAFPLTNDAVETLREQNPEHPTFEQPLDASIELLAPLSADGFAALGDPRIVRAISIAVDRAQLVERLYGGHGRASGPLPWFLEGWSISEQLLSTFPGYRNDREADLSDIADLLSAAGGAANIGVVPLVVADLFEGFFAGAGESVRSMIADATGLEVDLEDRPFAEAIDQLRSGERFCFLGWSAVPQQADPTEAWLNTLHSAGAQHWSASANAELDALLDQMKTTFNLGARQDLSHQVQQMLLDGSAAQWQIKLVNGVQLGIHQPWLNPDPRLFDYAWSTNRLNNTWLNTSHELYPTGRELPPLEEETEDGG